MSYRCDICGVKVPPGQPRLVYQVYYPRSKQIKQELGCCERCHLMLDELPLTSVKDPYYLRLRRFKEVDTVMVVREAKPSPLVAEALDLSTLEETFSRR